MIRSRYIPFGAWLICVFLMCSCAGAHAEVCAAARPAIESALADKSLAREERDALNAVYAGTGFCPLWSAGGQPSAPARAVVKALQAAGKYGLRAPDYSADALAARIAEPAGARDARSAAEFDVALSRSVTKFVTHLHFGRVKPAAAAFDLRQPRPPLAVPTVLRSLAASEDTAGVLATIEPQFHHYKLLKETLSHYRALAADPTLTKLPAFTGRAIEAGGTYSGAAALRRLLVSVGDLPAADPPMSPDTVLDPTLVEGLKRFQERHGLDADGVLGKRTFAALTTPLAHRVRQVELTLERWRWLPDFDTPPIIVNIPQFRLYSFQSTQDRVASITQMPVIVGREYPSTQTPVFVGELKYVVFRPYWDVPHSILTHELLPSIRSRPGYLEKNHFEIVRGQGDDATPVGLTPDALAALAAGKLRVRQLPGPDNALGLIKFMLPNQYNVYLHSTPARELFKQSRRAFSHGCIRVSDPVALAVDVLRGVPGDWNAAKVEEAMNGPPARRVYLPRPIRVMILYGTALTTEAGQAMFFEDIYNHDRKLETLLGLSH